MRTCSPQQAGRELAKDPRHRGPGRALPVGLDKEDKTCSGQEPYEEDENKDERSDSFRSQFCSQTGSPASSVRKARAGGGGPVLDWGSREREGRWWWLMARTWIQALWQH